MSHYFAAQVECHKALIIYKHCAYMWKTIYFIEVHVYIQKMKTQSETHKHVWWRHHKKVYLILRNCKWIYITDMWNKYNLEASVS